jgi:RNA polymerase sigma-70 factor (ECF subfamily)
VDPQVWARFLDRHAAFALGLARERMARAGFGMAEAEEAVQEVWVGLLTRGLPEGDGRPYLAAAVLNAVRMWLRRDVRRAAREAAQPSRASPEAPEESLIRAEEGGRLEQALGALGTEDRILIRWAYWDALPYAAIAELLGIQENSVGPRLSRALARLRESLGATKIGNRRTEGPGTAQ